MSPKKFIDITYVWTSDACLMPKFEFPKIEKDNVRANFKNFWIVQNNEH